MCGYQVSDDESYYRDHNREKREAHAYTYPLCNTLLREISATSVEESFHSYRSIEISAVHNQIKFNEKKMINASIGLGMRASKQDGVRRVRTQSDECIKV